MITLDGRQAGRVLGVDALPRAVTGVSTDSRSVSKGDLFVALRGEHFDGHDFVEMAFASGATGAVVQKSVWGDRPAASGGPLYQVEDTLEALGALAGAVRRASGAMVFAVTGSVGKTSTKDLLRAMVRRVCGVIATRGNQNNDVGLPLTLLSVEPDTEAVVVEMGMRGLGQIARLASIAEPDVGVITNVHPVHLELLGSLENIAQAKAEIMGGVKSGGAAVVPAACDVLEPYVERCDCRLVRFAAVDDVDCVDESPADVTGWLEKNGQGGGRVLRLRWPGGQTGVEVAHLPRHALDNAVAAAAACYAAGLSVEECAVGLADAEISEGRGQVTELGQLCVIDDTYNANPAGVRAAIDGLMEMASGRSARAVAVLGDMLELGPDSSRFHEEVGAYAARAGVGVLWGVGSLAEGIVKGFRDWQEKNGGAGPERFAVHVGRTAEAERVVESLKSGDVVLFKASRGVRLENVVRKVVDAAIGGRWDDAHRSADVDGETIKET